MHPVGELPETRKAGRRQLVKELFQVCHAGPAGAGHASYERVSLRAGAAQAGVKVSRPEEICPGLSGFTEFFQRFSQVKVKKMVVRPRPEAEPELGGGGSVFFFVEKPVTGGETFIP